MTENSHQGEYSQIRTRQPWSLKRDLNTHAQNKTIDHPHPQYVRISVKPFTDLIFQKNKMCIRDDSWGLQERGEDLGGWGRGEEETQGTEIWGRKNKE